MTEVTVVPDGAIRSITIDRAPDVVLTEATRAAKALTEVIAQKPRPVKFNGEQYLEFEDWQLLGRFYGLSVRVNEAAVKYVEFGDVRGFEASADVLRNADGAVISSASAMCLNDEQNWNRKPLFQLKSMAQTRACAKAFRNVLSWVAVLGGFKPTPAEEMDGVFPSEPFPTKNPQRKAPVKTQEQEVAEVFPEAKVAAPRKAKADVVGSCEQCSAGISDAVVRFSVKQFGKQLCFSCQKQT